MSFNIAHQVIKRQTHNIVPMITKVRIGPNIFGCTAPIFTGPSANES